MLESIIALFGGLGLDLAFGDPKNRYHPTAWIGSLVSRLTILFKHQNPTREKIGGIFIVLIPISIMVGLIAGLYHTISLVDIPYLEILAIVLGAILLKSTISIHGLERHALHVVRSLEKNIDSARITLSMIVKRDTTKLDRQHIMSGVLESVSENTVDGITGPLFYYGVFGLFGAFAHRIVNTADSMIGYRSEMFASLGWFAAKSDTILNYVPARLTALLMVVSSAILGHDWKKAYHTILQDGSSTSSKNAGYPMAALAGALNIKLEKPGHYTLGSGNSPLTSQHILDAISIMRLTSILFAVLITTPLLVGWWLYA